VGGGGEKGAAGEGGAGASWLVRGFRVFLLKRSQEAAGFPSRSAVQVELKYGLKGSFGFPSVSLGCVEPAEREVGLGGPRVGSDRTFVCPDGVRQSPLLLVVLALAYIHSSSGRVVSREPGGCRRLFLLVGVTLERTFVRVSPVVRLRGGAGGQGRGMDRKDGGWERCQGSRAGAG